MRPEYKSTRHILKSLDNSLEDERLRVNITSQSGQASTIGANDELSP